MLGEIHCLVNDFPELKDIVEQLIDTDKQFAEDNDRYNALDEEIREIELADAPIGDDAMHKLKHDRSVLKDSLYKRLIAQKSQS